MLPGDVTNFKTFFFFFLLRKFCFLECLVYGCENGKFVPRTHVVYITKSGLMCLAHLDFPGSLG